MRQLTLSRMLSGEFSATAVSVIGDLEDPGQGALSDGSAQPAFLHTGRLRAWRWATKICWIWVLSCAKGLARFGTNKVLDARFQAY